MNMIFEINCNNKAQDRIEIKSLFIMLIIGDMRTCQFGFGRVENWVVDGRFYFDAYVYRAIETNFKLNDWSGIF